MQENVVIDSIPDEDVVSRFLERPKTFAMEVLYDNAFAFTNSGRRESLVWRKYAIANEAVHVLGIQWETELKKRRPAATYAGFVSGKVGHARKIQTKHGIQCDIVHAPDQGIHHAEIRLVADGRIKPVYLEEVAFALKAVFTDLTKYAPDASPAPAAL